jgi:hypothetical protein
MSEDSFAELQKLKNRLESLGVKIKGYPAGHASSKVRELDARFCLKACDPGCPHFVYRCLQLARRLMRHTSHQDLSMFREMSNFRMTSRRVHKREMRTGSTAYWRAVNMWRKLWTAENHSGSLVMGQFLAPALKLGIRLHVLGEQLCIHRMLPHPRQ